MLTLILITSLTQVLSLPEQEFNLTLPEEFTTTTPEPFEDSSGEESGFYPKKAKKSKNHRNIVLGKGKKNKTKGKKGVYIHNSSSSEFLQTSSTSNSGNTILMASGVGFVCFGSLAILYRVRQRKSGYQKITPKIEKTYGTLSYGN